MARKRKSGRKVRVDFRHNREQPRRSDDWTRRFHQETEALEDERLHESVRAKGALSRKRTVVVGDDDTPLVDESLWHCGTVAAVHGLVCRVDDAEGYLWDCTVRRVLRTLLIEQRCAVTVGDRVWFSDQSKLSDGESVGVIERVAERRTCLSRRDRRGREHTIVANADQLLIVTSVAEPRLKPHLIDRYIVAAHNGELRPVLCINKIDLCAAPAEAERVVADVEDDLADESAAPLSLEQVVGEWRDLGYRCILTSVVAREGLAALRAELVNHVTVIAGQSGVGKSSLINAVQPGLNLAVRTVSSETEKGRHTTSNVALLRLDSGGYVVDTPGIRQFDLWAVQPGELEAFFIEFAPHVGACRFGDCSHRYEEGCNVIAALEAGAISPRRYASYRKMFEEV
ncbi:MAG: ribosome small subunit-dependent GTPase A [Planctomycetes bacterium]|nr:ribosome small subunit-dependent GTPase A [Planctomycetota bacterium]